MTGEQYYFNRNIRCTNASARGHAHPGKKEVKKGFPKE
jgi:hypothetical protein